jgi:hypothetical protein
MIQAGHLPGTAANHLREVTESFALEAHVLVFRLVRAVKNLADSHIGTSHLIALLEFANDHGGQPFFDPGEQEDCTISSCASRYTNHF